MHHTIHNLLRVVAVCLAAYIAACGFGTAAAVTSPDDYREIAAMVDASRIETHIRTLAGFGSRVPGYPGHELAREYVRAELEAVLGAQSVTTQNLQFAVPIDAGAAAMLPDGTRLALHCVWPNLVRTSTLPPDGLTAHIIYGGKGSLRELTGLDVEGAIVLLDFDCGDRWLKAVELGAKAVIFAETPNIHRVDAEMKFLSAPIPLPRFYAEADAADALYEAARTGTTEITLTGRMDWRNVQVQNLIASIEGTDPELKWQRVIIAANYDSISVVPAISPGAENAASVAGLLEIARLLAEHPPRRSVLLLASASRYQSMAGVTEFLRTFDAANTDHGYRRGLISLRFEMEIQQKRLPLVREFARSRDDNIFLQDARQQVEEDIAAKHKRIGELNDEIRVMRVRDFETERELKEAELEIVRSLASAHKYSPQVTGAINSMKSKIEENRKQIFLYESGLGSDEQAERVRKMSAVARRAAAEELEVENRALQDAIKAANDFNKRLARDREFFDTRIDGIRGELRAMGRDTKKKLSKAEQRRRVTAFFISLDLAAGSKQIGLFHRGNYEDNRDVYRQREYVPLGRVLRAVVHGADEFGVRRAGIANSLGIDAAERFAETISGRTEETIETFFAEPVALESEAVSFAMPGLSILTCGDARLRTNTPHDTPDRLDYGNLAEQLRLAGCLISDITRDETIDLQLIESRRLRGPVRARVVRLDQTRNLVPDTPVTGAVGVMQVSHGGKGAFTRGFPKPLQGVHTSAYSVADASGICNFSHFPWHWNARLDAFGLNPDTGEIEYAPDLGAEGNKRYNFSQVNVPSMGGGLVTCVLFECRAVSLVGFTDPRYLLTLQFLQLLDGRTESTPQFYGYTLALATRMDTSYVEPILVIYVRPGTTFKLTMSLGQVGNRLILINATDEHPEGEGFTADMNMILPRVSYQVAHDIHVLDSKRMSTLEEHGIVSTYLKEMHELAGKFLAAADEARRERRWEDFDRHARNAWSYESRVYPDLITISNDVVKGVIFYLALVIPFAWFMERLLFGFADIRYRIGCVAAIFMAVLIVLGLVHPAMRITMSPFLIFLAFAILALGSLVTGIVLLKFNVELNKAKGGMVALRQADVSRLSAAFAAFNLGVSYMRRRKIKTTLTCITLVLLTFTVLSFTSIRSYTRYNCFPLPEPVAPYEGILYRNLNWSPLETPELERFTMELSGEFIVAPRAWHVSERVEEYRSYKISGESGGRYVSASALAVVGLTPQESRVTGIHRSLIFGRWLENGERNVCILPEEMAATLGVTRQNVGEVSVGLLGGRFTVVGVFRQSKDSGDDGGSIAFDGVRDLDDGPLSPVSFKFNRPVYRRRDEAVQTLEGAIQEDTAYMAANSIVIVPFDAVIESGGTIRSVAAVPREDYEGDLDTRLRRLMTSWSVALFAGVTAPGYERPAGYLYTSIGASALGNIGNLLLPILLAGLIILNTMLSSVYEREKEIWTYSSVGLSPVHISALFIAESCVYAVVGSIIGYLLGQIVTHFTAGSGGLIVNYSSMSTVFALFLVMAVTVASSLYPAIRAHKLATPDIARTWQVSDPNGDEWELSLPFVITADQAATFNMYMKDFLESHSEESVGRFFVNAVQLEVRDGDRQTAGYCLKFSCWLAPYDFGVSQEAEIRTVYAETDAQGIEPDEDEMTFNMLIHRTSGDEASWRRTNRVFLNTLRKTFLIWRVLKPEDKAVYEKMAEESIEKKV